MPVEVSVIMSVWNGAATVGRALESALSQRFTDYEIIVADDGSSDATPDILKTYAGRIRIVTCPHRGIGPARTAAIAASNGEYLAFLDADDIWLPDKLAHTAPLLDRDPGCVLVYSDATLVNDDGLTVGTYVAPEAAHAPSLEEMLRRYWPILESMTLIRRAAFDQAGGFWPGSWRSSGVGFLWMRARELGHFHYVPERLVLLHARPYPQYIDINNDSRALLFRLVRERYGWTKSRRLRRGMYREINRDHLHHLNHLGLIAMRERRGVEARGHFMRALRHNPGNIKTALRLMRTFLPAPLARALTGRTRAA
ncbi:MAG: glycosyltransferase family A protein [Candidatus Binataceae bacterium]